MKSLLLGLALLVACSGFAVAQVMQEFPTDEELLIARDTWRVVTGVEGTY